MSEADTKFINDNLLRIAKLIPVGHLPYSGGNERCFDDGHRATPDEHWETLSEEDKEKFQRVAYAIWQSLGHIEVDKMMHLAAFQYFSEK